MMATVKKTTGLTSSDSNSRHRTRGCEGTNYGQVYSAIDDKINGRSEAVDPRVAWRSRTIVGQMGLDSLVSVSGGVDFILRILARLGWRSIRPERTPRVFGQLVGLVGTLGPRTSSEYPPTAWRTQGAQARRYWFHYAAQWDSAPLMRIGRIR